MLIEDATRMSVEAFGHWAPPAWEAMVLEGEALRVAGADLDYELIDGRPVPIAPNTVAQSLATVNLLRELGRQARWPIALSTRPALPRAGDAWTLRRPDVLVHLDARDSRNSPTDPALEPVAVIDLLPPRARRHGDAWHKLLFWRDLPRVQDILVVHTDRRWVTHLRRAEAGWLLSDHGPDGVVRLSGVPMHVTLTELYDGIRPAGSA